MKKLFFIAALLGLAIHGQAQPTYTEWHDLQVNDINRYKVHTTFFAYENESAALAGDMTHSANFLSLHGTWKFNWVENADQRPTNFYEVGLDDSSWKTMPVPGMWELNGYGDPEYVNSGFAWRGHFDQRPPAVPIKDNHVGSYRRVINIPDSWDGKQVIAHFGSVTSNIYLYVNGQFVGYAEDAKVAAEFDITPYIKKGENLIAFQTFRWCDGSWCEDQDFWRLSGVARDNYLYARNADAYLKNIKIVASLDDNYDKGTLTISNELVGYARVKYELLDAQGNMVWNIEGENQFDVPGFDTMIGALNVKHWTA